MMASSSSSLSWKIGNVHWMYQIIIYYCCYCCTMTMVVVAQTTTTIIDDRIICPICELNGIVEMISNGDDGEVPPSFSFNCNQILASAELLQVDETDDCELLQIAAIQMNCCPVISSTTPSSTPTSMSTSPMTTTTTPTSSSSSSSTCELICYNTGFPPPSISQSHRYDPITGYTCETLQQLWNSLSIDECSIASNIIGFDAISFCCNSISPPNTCSICDDNDDDDDHNDHNEPPTQLQQQQQRRSSGIIYPEQILFIPKSSSNSIGYIIPTSTTTTPTTTPIITCGLIETSASYIVGDENCQKFKNQFHIASKNCKCYQGRRPSNTATILPSESFDDNDNDESDGDGNNNNNNDNDDRSFSHLRSYSYYWIFSSIMAALLLLVLLQ